MDRLITPQGSLELDRYPTPRDKTLRAWDAADEYVLEHLSTLATHPSGATVVVNDRWGALATALATEIAAEIASSSTTALTSASTTPATRVATGGHSGATAPTSYGDSYISELSANANLVRNGLDPSAVEFISSLDQPPHDIGVVVVRVPRSLSLLEYQLHQLGPLLRPDTVVIGAGMVKDIHTSTLELFERILGTTTTSLARKKARLIFASPQPDVVRPRDPWPTTYDLPAGIGAASGLTVTQHAGVFSSERLDIGTRFLVENLPNRTDPETVVDLGCGNGVVGLAAGMANPHAEVTFIDESYLAVAAAEATYRAHVGPARSAHFVVGDGLSKLADGSSVERASVDLVLCNPPQRMHQARSDETAWRMFHESRNALRVGGELWVVGNQTLGYHAKLKRLFGNYETMASNRKFVVLRAVRT